MGLIDNSTIFWVLKRDVKLPLNTALPIAQPSPIIVDEGMTDEEGTTHKERHHDDLMVLTINQNINFKKLSVPQRLNFVRHAHFCFVNRRTHTPSQDSLLPVCRYAHVLSLKGAIVPVLSAFFRR